MALRRLIPIVGFILGLAALILQFGLTMPASLAAGRSLGLSLWFYFSFLTILSNLALVLVYAGELFPSVRWLAPFRHPVTRAAMVATMLLVMIFYHLILAPTWAPEGWAKVADIALHYATPCLYVAWWLVLAPHGALRWHHVPAMLAPLLGYFLYALARGAIVNEYPYPILEANRLGYGLVMLNAFYVLIGVAVLTLLAILADRLLAARPATDTPLGTIN